MVPHGLKPALLVGLVGCGFAASARRIFSISIDLSSDSINAYFASARVGTRFVAVASHVNSQGVSLVVPTRLAELPPLRVMHLRSTSNPALASKQRSIQNQYAAPGHNLDLAIVNAQIETANQQRVKLECAPRQPESRQVNPGEIVTGHLFFAAPIAFDGPYMVFVDAGENALGSGNLCALVRARPRSSCRAARGGTRPRKGSAARTGCPSSARTGTARLVVIAMRGYRRPSAAELLAKQLDGCLGRIFGIVL
jgi:hypothetical protein